MRKKRENAISDTTTACPNTARSVPPPSCVRFRHTQFSLLEINILIRFEKKFKHEREKMFQELDFKLAKPFFSARKNDWQLSKVTRV